MNKIFERIKKWFKKEKPPSIEVEKTLEKTTIIERERTIENAIFKPSRPRPMRTKSIIPSNRKVFRGAVKTAHEKRLWHPDAKLDED